MNLTPDQLSIIAQRGADLQIIACAGAGKTETISRRIAGLLHEGEPPEAIIAFTFTERAGAELKERVYRRAEEMEGKEFLDRLGPMFVGTIHGWCFHMLQNHVPHFGNHEVIDENRHAAFLSREAKTLDLKALGGGRHWAGIREWIRIVDVIGNELMTRKDLDASGLGEPYEKYRDLMERFHFLTFSQIISQAVTCLEDAEIHERVCGSLRHLIVDEYQDINPAQERLIQLLSKPPVHLCVVGDDDQAIYQWRGSDVRNMTGLAGRRNGIQIKMLLENRRSRPKIVETATRFAESITDRLPKTMKPVRPHADLELCVWCAHTDIDEGETIAETVKNMHGEGFLYGDIAILLRSVRTAGQPIFDALRRHGIPVSCGGRTGLFLQPEIEAFGKVYALLCGFTEWRRSPYAPPEEIDIENIAEALGESFRGGRTVKEISTFITDWISYLKKNSTRPVDLVGDYYRFLLYLKIPDLLDSDTERGSNILGSLARFSQLLADYEHVTRRGRYHTDNGRRVYHAGMDHGQSFWFGLGNYILHYALSAYDDYEGEEGQGTDSVQVLTIHQAKGLEWPVVFLASLVEGRFPSKRTGEEEEWAFPESVFPRDKRERYAGTDEDERRLFYTAMTRARDMLYCSCFEKKTRAFKPSKYLLEITENKKPPSMQKLPVPVLEQPTRSGEGIPLEISFSDMAQWLGCGYRYRLSAVFGFQQKLAEELGYGKAVHHVLRNLAEEARGSGVIPRSDDVISLVEKEFYTPFASEASQSMMFRSALRLVETYIRDYADDLGRIWELERSFEIHTDDGLLSGRADVILDKEGSDKRGLSIVDYKASRRVEREEHNEMQLRIYSHAGRREGFDVRAAYLHDLAHSRRDSIPIGEDQVAQAVAEARSALAAIRNRKYPAATSFKECSVCDYSHVCHYCEKNVRQKIDEWN